MKENQKLSTIQQELISYKNPEKAEFLSRFFKTGKGEYAEGDRFLGIPVPTSRKLAKKYNTLDINSTTTLLKSEYHEIRLIAIFIMVDQFKKGNLDIQKQIFEHYCTNIKYINNWDLVDESAPKISGSYLINKDHSILYQWIYSKSLWVRRIAIMSTFPFIRNYEYEDTFRLAIKLLHDKEDLIHKATGWMIREIYKRDPESADVFIRSNATSMPRTMLRYAIEKYPEVERKVILKMSATNS